MKTTLRSPSNFQMFFIALCCMLCCRTVSALPAISTYSAIRSGGLNGESESESKSLWPNDLEMYKVLHEIGNTMERAPRHADGLFTSGYSKLLGQLSAKEYLDSLLAKRISDEELNPDEMPKKRHSEGVFTHDYSRYRKQQMVNKLLNSPLAGKKRADDALTLYNQSKRIDPSLQQSYEDTIDQLLQQL